MTNKKLSPKQQAFAEHYIRLGNIEQAALEAGYSKNYARAQSHKLLANVGIKAYVDEQMQKLANKRIMGAQEALELLTSIARAEVTEEVVLSTENGIAKVDKIPDIRDRHRAAEELLKRYTLGDNQRLKDELLKAQIKKVTAETKNEEAGVTKITIVDAWADNDED